VVPPGASLPPPPPRDVARWMLGLTGPGPVIAYVGRVTAIKRPDRWIAVARRVREALPEARFVICGEGNRLAVTVDEAAAARLGLTFLPWRADVETVYAAADLVLLTSDNEGMPVCLIEAALAGRPAVATDVGGVAEVVRHGETGLLCRPDVDDLAGAVLRLLRDDDLCRRMGRRALAEATRRFTTARLVADTIDLYHRLATARLRFDAPPARAPGDAAEAGDVIRASAHVLVNEGGGRR
jgi:glycosyltransferase involved in cell wall biosynthesis